MNIREYFELVGGDYEGVMGRLQSEMLVTKFVKKFADDPSYEALIKAREDNDIRTAFRMAHTMKGVAATLGLEALAKASSELTEQLRPLETFPEDSYFKAVTDAYELVIGKLKELD